LAVFIARIGLSRTVRPEPVTFDRWLPFRCGSPEVASASGTEIAVWSWGAPLDRGLVSPGGRTLIVEGLALAPDSEIAAALDAIGPPGFADLPGSFAATLIADDRLIAYSGATGEYPLYWTRLTDGLLVSNRPGPVIGIAGALVDPEGGAWMASHGYNPLGVSTFRGVSQLRPGERLVACRQGAAMDIRVEVPSLGPLFEGCDASPLRLRGRIEDVLDQVVEGSAVLPPSSRTQLQITGGRDSRSVLAMVAAAGGLDRIDEFTTGGSPFSPDVLSARDVMATMNLGPRHRVTSDLRVPDFHSVIRTVLKTIGGTGCALSLHDRSEDALKPELLVLSGHRTVARPSSLSGLSSDSVEAFAAAAAQHRLDPAGILGEQAREGLREQRFTDFLKMGGRGVPTDRLAEAAVWFGRVSGWAGNLLAPHRAAHQHVNLLMDSRLTTLSMSMPRVCTDGELLSFLLVQRASPELVDAPFGHRGWLPALGPALHRVGAAELMPSATCAYRTPPPLRQMIGSAREGWPEQVLGLLAPAVGELARKHSDAIPYVDPDRLRGRLTEIRDGGSVDSLTTIALLGLTTVLIGCEYSTRLFDRNEQDAVADELGELVMRARRNASSIPGRSETGDPLDIRDEALAGFVVADRKQRQWAQSVERRVPRRNPVRRAGGKIMRSVRRERARRTGADGHG